jgi:hypothetical protein
MHLDRLRELPLERLPAFEEQRPEPMHIHKLELRNRKLVRTSIRKDLRNRKLVRKQCLTSIRKAKPIRIRKLARPSIRKPKPNRNRMAMHRNRCCLSCSRTTCSAIRNLVSSSIQVHHMMELNRSMLQEHRIRKAKHRS